MITNQDAITLLKATGPAAQVVAKFLMVGERFHAPRSTEYVWTGQMLTVVEVLPVRSDWMWLNDQPTVIIICTDNAGISHSIWENSSTFVRLAN